MPTPTDRKKLRPAYEDKRHPAATVPYSGHGRVVCACGAVVAACAHLGHQQPVATVPACPACRG